MGPVSSSLQNTFFVLVYGVYETPTENRNSKTSPHKEEAESRESSDAADRNKIRDALKIHTDPPTSEREAQLSNIKNGRVAPDKVNADGVVVIG